MHSPEEHARLGDVPLREPVEVLAHEPLEHVPLPAVELGDAVDVRPAILNGQCLLVPRRRLLDAGGMEPVHDALVEDVALARTLTAAGWKLGWVDATALAEVEGYADARATWDGWGRSIALPGVEPAARLLGKQTCPKKPMLISPVLEPR